MSSLQVLTILPRHGDNYGYILYTDDSDQAVLIDAPYAKELLEGLKALNKELGAIVFTHDDHDHLRGLEFLKRLYPTAQLFAHKDSSIGELFPFLPIENNQSFKAGGLSFRAFFTPGHSSNHLIFYAEPHLFVGDNLFALGCGRAPLPAFPELFQALQRIASFPPATKVYFGHDYGENNLQFLLSIDPTNAALLKLKKHPDELTSPRLLKEELKLNPFLLLFQGLELPFDGHFPPYKTENDFSPQEKKGLELFHQLRIKRNKF